MEMHQIRYFLAVARTLNFTRAADQCNVTQPSLTRAIQKLEEEFGGLLFKSESDSALVVVATPRNALATTSVPAKGSPGRATPLT